MAHAHDDPHADDAAAPAPATAEPRPAPHVVAVARATNWLGLVLWLGGLGASLVYLWRGSAVPFGWSAFASLYGFCIWLAARDTMSRGGG